MKLYQYAIFCLKKNDKDTTESKILVEPKTLLAKDEKQVAILASREIPEAFLDKLDQVEIAVRPF